MGCRTAWLGKGAKTSFSQLNLCATWRKGPFTQHNCGSLDRITTVADNDATPDDVKLGSLRQAKTAPWGGEHNSPKRKAEPGGSKEGDWAYTGLMPGAKMEIPADWLKGHGKANATPSAKELQCDYTIGSSVFRPFWPSFQRSSARP